MYKEMLSYIPNSVQVQIVDGVKDEKDRSKEFLPKKPKVFYEIA